ncbi:MAG: DNA-directed RNA polymerase subunit omega [Bacilli bacterium]|nr:DNA-directed RNA polymerase subunit omega [Bacilli bacterium]
MIYPSIDKLVNIVGSKFLLVNVVSKRVKEMEENDYYQLSDYKSAKNIGKALEEVSKGLIHIKEEQD